MHIAVNCTPDEITRRSDLELKVDGRYGAEKSGMVLKDLCPAKDATGKDRDGKDRAGTALFCAFDIRPGQEQVDIRLSSGLLQQCQILATAFDRAN